MHPPPQKLSLTLLTSFTFLLSLCGCRQEDSTVAEFPRKPIKIIVPFGAGGGSDTFTRIIQKAVTSGELCEQPLVVVNVPGAAGSIGSRKVKNSRPDGYTILQIHDGMLTNKYSGNANFGPEAFIPIAGTGQMAHIIAVSEDSSYRSLNDLLGAAAEKPDSIVFAVGIGAPSHFAGLMLESASASDAKFRFAQSGGGAKRFASLLGGHSEVTTFSVSEYVEFRKSGVRALAILSNERSEQVPEVQTAREQGVEAVSTNMHFWWAPKGTPPDRVAEISNLLKKAMETQEVQEQLTSLATVPIVLTGKQLADEIKSRESSISSVSKRTLNKLPSFGLYAAFAAGVFGVLAFLPNMLASNSKQQDALSKVDVDRKKQFLAFTLVLLYVGVLSFGLIDYRLSTIGFVAGLGILMAGGELKQLLPFIVVGALGTGLILHTIFTRYLVIDLP